LRARSPAPSERHGGRAAAPPRARSTTHRGASSPASRPVNARAMPATPVSPREFSPERARGESSVAPSHQAAPTPTSAPPASSGAAGEFGIE
ncbi:MAG: hypothetical protein ACRDK4_13925, partial [Solirubrobacteraceae bacterium]